MEPMEPAIGPDQLLTQRAFLVRLARGLLGDEALAEDVVQEVELRALNRPPASGASPAGWLATVTRNLARNALRSRARRDRHEGAAARAERVETHAGALEGLELQRRVLAAVHALRDPYRTVVWLRFYEDRTPSEIAAELALPLATVKTRLRRALDELRSSLDRASGGERRAWMAALVPLVRPAAPAVPLGTLVGVLAMKKVAVVFVVAALGWLGWKAWPQRGAHVLPVSASASPALAVQSPEVVLDAAAPAAATREAVAAMPTPVTIATGLAALELRVRWSDGTDAADVGLTLWPEDDARPELCARSTTTDAGGGARFAELAPGRWTLHTDRDTHESLALAPDEALALELALPAGVDVAGMVVVQDGLPVPDAEIWLESPGTGLLGGRVAALSGPDGSFALRSLGAGQGVAAAHEGHWPSSLELLRDKVPVNGERGLQIELVLGSEYPPVTGVVLDERGLGVAGALVSVGTWGNDSVQRADGRWESMVKARVLVTDAAGRFAVSWGGGEVPLPVHVLASGHALAKAEAWDPNATDDLVLRIGPGATIEGSVSDADGAPVGGALVRLLSAGILDAGCPFPLPRATSGADGSYRMEHVPPGSVTLSVAVPDAPQQSARGQRTLADGAHERWDVVLASRASIAGVARDFAGVPISKAQIVVDRGTGRSILAADDAGRFTLWPSDPEQVYTLELVVQGSVRARREGVRAGDQVELVAAKDSASVRGRFVDAGNRARVGERIHVRLAAEEFRPVMPTTELAPDGAFAFPDVAPGRYRASFASEQREIARSDWFELVPGDALDLGMIESRTAGSLVVDFRTDTSERCTPAAWLVDDEGSTRQLFADGDVFRTDDVEPGRYVLRADDLGLEAHEQEVVIESGRETRLTVVLTLQRSE